MLRYIRCIWPTIFFVAFKILIWYWGWWKTNYNGCFVFCTTIVLLEYLRLLTKIAINIRSPDINTTVTLFLCEGPNKLFHTFFMSSKEGWGLRSCWKVEITISYLTARFCSIYKRIKDIILWTCIALIKNIKDWYIFYW